MEYYDLSPQQPGGPTRVPANKCLRFSLLEHFDEGGLGPSGWQVILFCFIKWFWCEQGCSGDLVDSGDCVVSHRPVVSFVCNGVQELLLGVCHLVSCHFRLAGDDILVEVPPSAQFFPDYVIFVWYLLILSETFPKTNIKIQKIQKLKKQN